MNILFLCINKYKKMTNLDISFSPKYTMKRNDDMVYIQKNNQYFNLFGPNIYSINAIVGKNGVGKTSILEILSGDIKDPEGSFFIILESNGRFYLQTYHHESPKIYVDNKAIQVASTYIGNTVFLSNYIKIARFSLKGLRRRYKNVQSINMLRANEKSIESFMLRREIPTGDFLSSLMEHTLAAKLMISFDDKNLNIFKGDGDTELAEAFQKSITKNIEINGPNIKTLLQYVVLYVLYRYLNLKIDVPQERSTLYEMLNQLLTENSISFGDRYGLQYILTVIDKSHAVSNNEGLIIPNEYLKDHKFFNLFLSFLSEYFKQPLYKFLNLSQGEKYLFSFVGNVENVFREVSSFDHSLVILIDELEAFLHPEWCRKLIHLLVEISRLYSNIHNVQFILSTHSPYVISDLPKDYVVQLKYEDGKVKIPNESMETFAANIHELLIKAFFMNSTTGEFAKQKINEVIDFLNTPPRQEENIEEVRYIIESIGDSVLKKILKNQMQEYELKHNRDFMRQKKIQELRAELNILEKQVGSDKDDYN
ncbi:hypothetical protein ICU_04705 [Bacillus cereus BAG2X1-1]|nr:hypothetical protein ICU_04705 [Bacillus cereus BAG2X1-1]